VQNEGERISASNWERRKIDLKRLDLRKLDDVEVKEKYHVEIWNTNVASAGSAKIVWILVVLEKVLEPVSVFQPKKICDIMG
jgi:hypothetical protein